MKERKRQINRKSMRKNIRLRISYRKNCGGNKEMECNWLRKISNID